MGAFPYLRDQPDLQDKPGSGDSPSTGANLKTGASPALGGSAGFHRRHWAGFGQELLPALLLLGLLGPGSAAAGLPWQGWLGLVPALLVPWGLGRRLGGHSGDTYGACVEWTCSWSLLLMALAQVLAP
jgi:adenosylcobinamide-GDP ribazoletransferase